MAAASVPSARIHRPFGATPASSRSIDKGTPVHSLQDTMPWISPQLPCGGVALRFGRLLPEHSINWIRDTIGYRCSASMLKTNGLSTRPWISSRCASGSISGIPLWWRSKCKALGVIVPCRLSNGVREAPVPVVPGTAATPRVTSDSNGERSPYADMPSPGARIQGGISCDAAGRAASRPRLPAPISAAP